MFRVPGELVAATAAFELPLADLFASGLQLVDVKIINNASATHAKARRGTLQTREIQRGDSS